MMMLYDRGEALGVDDNGRPIRSGIDSEIVERVLRFGEWGGLCGARDLRKSPLMAPSSGGD